MSLRHELSGCLISSAAGLRRDSGLLLLPAKGDFIGAGVLNWDDQRSLEQVVKMNRRSGKAAKEDAVSPEGTTCCLW